MTAAQRRGGLRGWQVHSIGAGGFAVLSVIAALAVVNPVLTARAERASLRSELERRQLQLADLEQARRDVQGRLDATRQELGDGRLQLESSGRLNRRMARLVELAATSGLDIHEMRPGTPVTGDRYDTVPIMLSGQGSYPQCAGFLHLVHETLPDTGVTDLDLSGNPTHPELGARFRFDVVWYAAPDPAAASP